MTLSEISAALQRGEALTATQKFFVRDSLLGRPIRGPKSYDEDAWAYVVYNEGDRFTSLDAALAFVAEVFPGNIRYPLRLEKRLGGNWAAHIGFTSGYDAETADDNVRVVFAPTPSAAIMAAAIEAFLAKGGE